MRADAIRFLLSGFQGRELRRLAGISSKLFSEISHGRRQQFSQKREVDLKGTREV